MKKAILLITITGVFTYTLKAQELNDNLMQVNYALKWSSFNTKYIDFFERNELKDGYGIEFHFAAPVKKSPINIKLYTEISVFNSVRRDIEMTYYISGPQYYQHTTSIAILNMSLGLGVHYIKRFDRKLEIDLGVNTKAVYLAQISPLNATPFVSFGPEPYEAHSDFTSDYYKPFTLGATVGFNYYPFKNPNAGISFAYSMDQFFTKDSRWDLEDLQRFGLSLGFTKKL